MTTDENRVPAAARDGSTRPLTDGSKKGARLAGRVQSLITERLAGFPWQLIFHDWTGSTYKVGGKASHWCGEPLVVTLKSEAAAQRILSLDPMGFLEKFLEGEVDFTGNIFLITRIKYYAKFNLTPLQIPFFWLRYRAFQNQSRAKVSVKSHYDMSQEALDIYLDKVYMSYSCGMFEHPERLIRSELLEIGRGEEDDFDSLEKAQWRKFKDAVDYIAPERGETLLDVGCGYGGQLLVALESHPFGKVVGWTHSANQVRHGRRLLSTFAGDRWQLNEGDYREDDQVFDHVTSTGMVSHVGPRGLEPYVRNIRKRIKPGGRYLHHALMCSSNTRPQGSDVGLLFNKKYVWPGFHWFTVGMHVRALERNGFQILRMTNLSEHYAKTTATWYERMMDQREEMVRHMGEATFRAWQIYLAGATESFGAKTVHVYRLYCEAV